MPETLTLKLARPFVGLQIVGTGGTGAATPTGPEGLATDGQEEPLADGQLDQHRKLQELEQQENHLGQLCQMVESMVTKLDDFHRTTIAQSRGDIAKLAVEIARKILEWKTSEGDYDMQAVVEEALKQAPTRQELVVRLNPEDLPLCQQLQQQRPDTPFAELNLVADWSVARADCLIETPKGIVRSFVEEHLDRIAEALEKAQ